VELARLVHSHHLPPRQEDHLHNAPDIVPHCLHLQVSLEGFDLIGYEEKGGGREGERKGGRERHGPEVRKRRPSSKSQEWKEVAVNRSK